MQIAVVAVVMVAVSPSASAAARPDLIVPQAKPQALQAAAGASVAVTVGVRNAARGKAARSSVVRLLLSRDARRDGDQILAPATRVGRLKPRKTSRRRMTRTVPVATAAGSYHVLACADATKRVRERSERNNCRAVATLLVAGRWRHAPRRPGRGA
jgi:subtilase family serine protease